MLIWWRCNGDVAFAYHEQQQWQQQTTKQQLTVATATMQLRKARWAKAGESKSVTLAPTWMWQQQHWQQYHSKCTLVVATVSQWVVFGNSCQSFLLVSAIKTELWGSGGCNSFWCAMTATTMTNNKQQLTHGHGNSSAEEGRQKQSIMLAPSESGGNSVVVQQWKQHGSMQCWQQHCSKRRLTVAVTAA